MVAYDWLKLILVLVNDGRGPRVTNRGLGKWRGHYDRPHHEAIASPHGISREPPEHGGFQSFPLVLRAGT